jgi:hypothetical protein
VVVVLLVMVMHILQIYVTEVCMEGRIEKPMQDRTYEEREEWIGKWIRLKKEEMDRQGGFDGLICRAVDRRSKDARKKREIQEIIEHLPGDDC